MITGIGFDFHKFKFPCGEPHIQLINYSHNGRVSLHFIWESIEDIFTLLLICHALKREGIILERIVLPYVPFSRQDRVNIAGEPFSLKVFADIINSCNAKVVEIEDPHSDVTTALINNVKVRYQHEIFERYFKDKKDFYLICPDGGALKKIYKLAAIVNTLGVIECSKLRNTKTGEITDININCQPYDIEGKECIIVDDICDGGRTFVELAKVLKRFEASKVTLMITHGFFTKGIEVFDNLIDEIYTNKGRVK